MTKIAISHELLVRFGPNKNQRKAYSVHRLFVIVSVSFGAFLTSGVTMKCFTLVQIAMSRKLLVRFGQNKNQRKGYSVYRLLVIVLVLFGTFVTSQVTKYCVTLLIRWGYQQINGKMWSNPETGRRGQLCLSTEGLLVSSIIFLHDCYNLANNGVWRHYWQPIVKGDLTGQCS